MYVCIVVMVKMSCSSKIMMIIFLFLYIVGYYGIEIKVGHMKMGRNRRFKNETIVANALLDIAAEDMKEKVFNQTPVEFKFLIDEGCWALEAPKIAFRFYTEEKVNAILGPACSLGMDPIGKFAAGWNLTLLGFLSTSSNLQDKTVFQTLSRVSINMQNFAEATVVFLCHFNWKRVAVVTEDRPGFFPWLYRQGIVRKLQEENFNIVLDVQLNIYPLKKEKIQATLEEIKSTARVIILALDAQIYKSSEFLYEASLLNMTGPDYIWIVPWLDKNSTKLPWNMGHTIDSAIYKIFTHSLTFILLPDGGADEIFGQLPRRIVERLKNTIAVQIEELRNPNWLAYKYDALKLYSLAIMDCLETEGCDWQNGHHISKLCADREFEGASGHVIMTTDRDRLGNFIIQTADNNDINKYITWFRIPVQHEHVNNHIKYSWAIETPKAFEWKTEDKKPPPDIPRCGFNNDQCPDNSEDNIMFYILGIIAIGILVVIWVFWRWYKLKQEMLTMTWRISASDILHLQIPALHSMRCASVGSMGTIKSAMTSKISSDLNAKYPSTVDIFQGQKVFIQSFRLKEKMELEEKHQFTLLKGLKELSHPNINAFVGLSLTGENLVVISTFCQKGSLEDIVHNSSIHFDLTFKASIVRDVYQGLAYLHRSKCGVHGQLTASNCVVDSRWVVKLTDFGLAQLVQPYREIETLIWKGESTSKLLQMAPEILRSYSGFGFSEPPTQPADIYGFGMVCYQVLFRKKPFDNAGVASDEDMLEEIQNPHGMVIRPVMPKSDYPPSILAVIRQCWQEDPSERPTLAILQEKISLMISTDSDSLFDHMMGLMETYANNLEKMVESRTEELLLERQRADELLNRLLPRTIAHRLKNGLSVEPESFRCATVFFSDIVEFTPLCSSATPEQVVRMMNEIYSIFDEVIENHDAYKVETVGDAYLVVSGVPTRNGDLHVMEVADMTLEVRREMIKFRVSHSPDKGVQIRFGFHTGPLAAGVVGLVMPHYCLFGDTVNMASRMESTGKPTKIHISLESKEFLERVGPLNGRKYEIAYRGITDIKGKGPCPTYWLEN